MAAFSDVANNDNYKKFKDLVTIAKQLGSNIGVHSDCVNLVLQDIAVDPDMLMEGEMEHAKERAKDEYPVVMFLVNSDLNQYRDLVHGIENDYIRGLDTYPATLSAAYDYLVNYWPAGKMNPYDADPELSFYNEDRTWCRAWWRMWQRKPRRSWQQTWWRSIGRWRTAPGLPGTGAQPDGRRW
jgi:hypothetical protein